MTAVGIVVDKNNRTVLAVFMWRLCVCVFGSVIMYRVVFISICRET